MHPGALNKKAAAARMAIAEYAQELAEQTGQTFNVPTTYLDLVPNLGAPLDAQMLALAELVAELARLIVVTQTQQA